MSSETQQTSLEEEIQKLRATKESLHQTAQSRKARIAELETEVADLKTKLDDTAKKLHEAVVGAPVRAMAKDVSTVPALFEREFLSRFGIVECEGVLCVTKVGESEPIKLDGKENLSFTSSGLDQLFKSELVSDEDKTLFNAILIGSRASGSGASGAGRGQGGTPLPKKPVISSKPVDSGFGLR